MSTLMIPILKEILMKEIGETNIPPLNWRKMGATRYKFLVNIGESTEGVTVQFENFDQDSVSKQFYLPAKFQSLDKTYNVAYDVSGDDVQFSQSDIKTLLTILSTVTAIVKDFIASEDPNALYIEATEKEEGKIQKSNLYKAYILQQLKTIPGYQAESRREGELIFKK
jgi:hypothetical protein